MHQRARGGRQTRRSRDRTTQVTTEPTATAAPIRPAAWWPMLAWRAPKLSSAPAGLFLLGATLTALFVGLPHAQPRRAASR
jgi:hypothetical protein